MVTAGVFLLLRCSFLFEYSSNVLLLLVLFGGFTAFFMSFVGVFQYDVKKIIAYSTCSQLGYMFLSCGLSNYITSVFHLFNHAFFKALLFLSAGSIIHALSDEQDIRRMGATLVYLPFTYICIFIGSLAIMGFPFLTGFYSKDMILEFSYMKYILDGYFVYFLSIGAAFFTAVYSIRLIYFVFFGKVNYFSISVLPHDSTSFMYYSMFMLAFLSVFVGFVFSDVFNGWGTFYWYNALFVIVDDFFFIDAEFCSPFIKIIPLFLCVFGYYFSKKFIRFFKKYLFFNYLKFYSFYEMHYFFPKEYLKLPLRKVFFLFIINFLYHFKVFFSFAGFFNFFFDSFFLFFYKYTYLFTKYLDKGYFEFFGPFGFFNFFFNFSVFFRLTLLTVLFFSIFFLFMPFFIFFYQILLEMLFINVYYHFFNSFILLSIFYEIHCLRLQHIRIHKK